MVPLHGASPPTGQQPEPFVEEGRDLRRCHRTHARGRELDREWYPVESAADLADRSGVVQIQHEAGIDGAGAVDEQPNRVRARHNVERVGRARSREGTQRPELLAGNAEALTARCEHPDIGAGLKDALDERAHRRQQVLAVVHDEQHILRAQKLDDAVEE